MKQIIATLRETLLFGMCEHREQNKMKMALSAVSVSEWEVLYRDGTWKGFILQHASWVCYNGVWVVCYDDGIWVLLLLLIPRMTSIHGDH